MDHVEEHEQRAAAAFEAADVAHERYLETLAEQWRELATSKVRKLVVDLQPDVTAEHGDQFSLFREELQATIDAGADRAPELFRRRSEPSRLVTGDGRGPDKIDFGGYEGPTDTLTQPLHDLLKKWKYNPDRIKAASGAASYSSSGFTESDFPLPSIEITKTYRQALVTLAESRKTLAQSRHEANSATAANLWDDG